MKILDVENLRKSYSRGFIPRRTEVLKGLSFSVPAGLVTGFLGANGAGKTTTMRCVLGLDYADSGKIEFFGGPLDAAARKRLGFLPERPYFYEHLSGVEFLTFYAQLTANWTRADLRARILNLLRRVDLEFAKDRPLRTYSKGMLQKIGLAQALIHEPELVILDEPMSGLDPDGRMALADLIVETAKKGTAAFVSSPVLLGTENLCQRLSVIKDGHCIFEGPTQKLLEQDAGDSEIVFVEKGERRALNVAAANAQSALRELLGRNAEIVEVRPKRATLEDVFVRMALKGRSP